MGSAVLGCSDKDVDGFESPRSNNIYPVFCLELLSQGGHAMAQFVEAPPQAEMSLEYFIDIILPSALWPWDRLSLQQI